MKIILVEDNRAIVKGLEFALKQNNYDVCICYNFKSAIEALEEESFTLAILDISLTDGNGFELYKIIKQKYPIPTIFLTAKDDEDDIVYGLELGAEDYITKPFSTRELIARIKRITMKINNSNILKAKNIKIDLDKMLVYKQDRILTLTTIEYKILSLLFINKGKIVTRNLILEKIWDWTGNDVNDNTVTVYLKRIREKLKSNIITTIKGMGYRIDDDGK